MTKVEFKLNGLNCAHCASVIEETFKTKDKVINSSLNFISSNLSIELEEGVNIEEFVIEAKAIIDSIEPGLNIVSNIEKQGDSKDEEKKRLDKIIIATVLYIGAIVISKLNINEYVSISLFIIAYLFIGFEVLSKAIKNLIDGRLLDENFLMAIATIGAIAIGEYPEAVGVMLFFSVGEYLEGKAVAKSRKNIEELMNIKPDIANLIDGDEILKVDPYKVKVGDLVLVRVGEKVPLDGVIVKGESMFDTSAITGESVLRESYVGDTVLSGIINKKSVVTIEVKKCMEDSTVSKILDMVENATSKKSKTENFITVFAKYYTPVVVGLALFIALIIPLFMGDLFGKWFYRGLIFLVVSCPCALVLSIPLSYFSGIGVSSKNGILIKGSNYLETLKNVDTVVMDKTGTITKGVFNVSEILLASDDITEEMLIKYAYISESRSNHPIAKSITEYYNSGNFERFKVEEEKISMYEEISSNGIRIRYDGHEILSGNSRLMKNFGINFHERNNASTKVHVCVDNRYLGCIEISDEIKDGIKDTIKELKEIGVREIAMLTGDTDSVAKEVAKSIGIDSYYSNLLPNEKVDILEAILSKKSGNSKVAFVGDGINDAPVIARADIGISMGGIGSDAAIEASDIVFMTDEISKMPISIKIARKTSNILWQNIVFAIGMKILVMILSTFGMANMWMAIFADVGVTLIAVLNSLRILRNKY